MRVRKHGVTLDAVWRLSRRHIEKYLQHALRIITRGRRGGRRKKKRRRGRKRRKGAQAYGWAGGTNSANVTYGRQRMKASFFDIDVARAMVSDIGCQWSWQAVMANSMVAGRRWCGVLRQRDVAQAKIWALWRKGLNGSGTVALSRDETRAWWQAAPVARRGAAAGERKNIIRHGASLMARGNSKREDRKILTCQHIRQTRIAERECDHATKVANGPPVWPRGCEDRSWGGRQSLLLDHL